MTGDRPPEVMIQIGSNEYKTKLGTYCWNSFCIDTIGTVELLGDWQPVQVNPNEEITFVMGYEPKPNQFHLVQYHDENMTEIEFNDNKFNAPAQSGIYYYDYGVWWLDAKVEHLSHGSAFYAFVLEVK